MAEHPSSTLIVSGRLTAFRVGYASWITAVAIAFVVGAFVASDATGQKAALCLLLAPVLVAASSRWVAAATRTGLLVGRAVFAHIAAAFGAVILMGIARSGDPGFSGHGGAILLLMVMIPFCAAGGSVLGVLGALTGRLVARSGRS